MDFELIVGTGTSPMRDLEKHGGLLRFRALDAREVDEERPTPVVHGYRAAVLTQSGVVGMPSKHTLDTCGYLAYAAYALAYSATRQWDIAAVLPTSAGGHEYLIEAAANAAVTNAMADETYGTALAAVTRAFAASGFGLADEVLAVAHIAESIRGMGAAGPRDLDRYRWVAKQAQMMACPSFTESAVQTRIVECAMRMARENKR